MVVSKPPAGMPMMADFVPLSPDAEPGAREGRLRSVGGTRADGQTRDGDSGRETRAPHADRARKTPFDRPRPARPSDEAA